MTYRIAEALYFYLLFTIPETPVILRMVNVISPKGRCRKAQRGAVSG